MTASLDDWIHCAECGAMNAPDSAECSECGAPLGEEPPTRRDDEPRRRNPRTQKLVMLAKTRQRLKGVRGIQIFLVVSSLMGAFVSFVLDALPMVWIDLGLAGLFAAGAVYLYRAPLAWTVVTAAVWSVWTVFLVWEYGVALTLPGILNALRLVVMVLLWLAVPTVRKAQRILENDERAEERLSLRYRTDAAPSESRDRVQSRRYREEQAANRTALYVILGIVGAAVLGVGGYLLVGRVAPIDDEPAKFGAALAAGDLDAAKAFATEEQQSRWPNVVRILERESWASGVEVGPPSTYRSGDEFHEIHYALPRGKLKTIWIVESREWRARRVVFSKVRAKDD